MKIDSKMTLQILVAGMAAIAFVFGLLQMATPGIKEGMIVSIVLLTLSGVVLSECFFRGKFKFNAQKTLQLVIALSGIIMAITIFVSIPIITGLLVPATGVLSWILAVAAMVELLT
jgi:hypothetical protein